MLLGVSGFLPARAHGQLPDAGVSVAARPLDGSGGLVAGEGGEGRPEHDAHLEPRQIRAEAEVHAVAEGEMRVRLAPDVELHGALEDELIAVRRALPIEDLVAGLDGVAVDFGAAS